MSVGKSVGGFWDWYHKKIGQALQNLAGRCQKICTSHVGREQSVADGHNSVGEKSSTIEGGGENHSGQGSGQLLAVPAMLRNAKIYGVRS